MPESPISPSTAPSDRPALGVIVVPAGSGVGGLPVGQWFVRHAEAHGGFVVCLIDVEAPVTNGLNPDAEDSDASERPDTLGPLIDAVDALVFILPAYEQEIPAAFTALLDWFSHEWQLKPAGFVSYGEMSSGIREVLKAKPILAALKMTPTSESVTISHVSRSIGDGRYASNARLDDIATSMLDELDRWTRALRPLRAASPSPD